MTQRRTLAEQLADAADRPGPDLAAPAPRTAARYYAAALRLGDDRDSRLQRLLADAQAAAGDAEAARLTLLDALHTAGPDERLALTVALANQEWWLGSHEEARRRRRPCRSQCPPRCASRRRSHCRRWSASGS